MLKEEFKSAIFIILICGIVYFSINIYSLITNKSIEEIKNNGLGTLIANNIKLEDSGITGEEYDFNTIYHPYYGMLSENDKELYKQIYANALEYKDTFVPVVEIKIDRLVDVIESVLDDHPELFWLGNDFYYKYDSKNICKQITLSFNGTQVDKELFNEKANEIINEAKKYKYDYEKELFVHDRLLDIVEYDSDAPLNQTAYSALINGRTVCAGYSRAFQYIMMQLGIPTYYVTGFSDDDDHAWNIVKLSDGYYNVDLTWDDRLHHTHTLFNKTDDEFAESHQRSKLSQGLVPCRAEKYKFTNISNKVEEQFSYHPGNYYE